MIALYHRAMLYLEQQSLRAQLRMFKGREYLLRGRWQHDQTKRQIQFHRAAIEALEVRRILRGAR